MKKNQDCNQKCKFFAKKIPETKKSPGFVMLDTRFELVTSTV